MSAGFHHVELWLANGIPASGWPWLLEQVGFVRTQSWEGRRVLGRGRRLPDADRVANVVGGAP